MTVQREREGYAGVLDIDLSSSSKENNCMVLAVTMRLELITLPSRQHWEEQVRYNRHGLSIEILGSYKNLNHAESYPPLPLEGG